MTQIIAIYGKTCSLKTDVSREISRMTGFKVTNRGELATTKAKVAALPTAAHLSEEAHREVDRETLRIAAMDEELLIMESAFIDNVLKDHDNVFFVHLSSRDDVRVQRWDKRKEEGGGRTRQLGESVAARDREDAELRVRLYGNEPGGVKPAVDIDTSDRSAEDVAAQILDNFHAESGVQLVPTCKPEMDKSAATGVRPGASSGVVKSYNPNRAPFGGYVTDDKSGQDVFLHKSALSSGAAALEKGQRIDFNIVEDGFGGFKAIDVKSAA
ncbi:MAG: cold shock domain-containing protein [Gammaproteobacteria bacterium]